MKTENPNVRGDVFCNLSASRLVEHALARNEGELTSSGAFAVRTGAFTGRSPQDKFIARTTSSEPLVWWGKVNQPISPEKFDSLYKKVCDYLHSRPIYSQDLSAGADPRYNLGLRVITEFAWHSLFSRTLLRGPEQTPVSPESRATLLEKPFDGFKILCAPGCMANPEEDGTRSKTFVVLNFEEKIVLIGGTEYAGEIKKSVFTILNYLLPQQNVLPMHCSANVGLNHSDVALFFGLSGTGKTTLSADPTRALIGDDEHGWSDHGVFNFEGGCYAKCINLTPESEPQIYNAIKFGSVLENVPVDRASGEPDYKSTKYTENTRVAYPLNYIPGAMGCASAGHPQNIVFLTADAFGVLPPVSRLTHDQAIYHFLSGYTARVAGTERGMDCEPQATFSACFGQPFLPLPPAAYADMLAERLCRYDVKVWLLNTGWQGGPYGVGTRVPLALTRRMLDAAIEGELDDASMAVHPLFGLQSPTAIPGVPAEVLNPCHSWTNPSDYQRAAINLAQKFRENFKQYHGKVSQAVENSGPTT